MLNPKPETNPSTLNLEQLGAWRHEEIQNGKLYTLTKPQGPTPKA